MQNDIYNRSANTIGEVGAVVYATLRPRDKHKRRAKKYHNYTIVDWGNM